MTIENQEQTQTEAQATDPAAVSRDELIAAVRAAGGTEAVDVAAEEAAAAARAQGTETQQQAQEGGNTEQTQAADDEPALAALLRQRETDLKARDAARNQAQELLEQAQREAARVVQEARQKAQQEWDAEMERKRAAFRASPTEHLRALGDPKEIADSILRDGTPEGRAIQQLQRELAETKQKAAVADDIRKQFDDFQRQQAEQQRAQVIAQVRHDFLSHATPEKAPHLHARYDADEIFAKADQVALQLRNAGVAFDYPQLVQYMEHEAKKRFASLGLASPQQAGGTTPPQQVRGGAPGTEPGSAPKVQANGPRTLSAAQGSERRTSPKPITEMKPDEARAALIEEVAAARRSNPDSAF